MNTARKIIKVKGQKQIEGYMDNIILENKEALRKLAEWWGYYQVSWQSHIVWYGSINLFSFGSAEESIMRLDSPNIADELTKSIWPLQNK